MSANREPFNIRVGVRMEMTERQLRADREQLRAIASRLFETKNAIGRAASAIEASRILLAQDTEQGTRSDAGD
jgi:hypothetical protein